MKKFNRKGGMRKGQRMALECVGCGKAGYLRPEVVQSLGVTAFAINQLAVPEELIGEKVHLRRFRTDISFPQ